MSDDDDHQMDTDADEQELQCNRKEESQLSLMANLAISDPTGGSLTNEKDLSPLTPAVVQALYSEDVTIQLEATEKICELFFDPQTPLCEEIIKSGAVSRLVHFLEDSRYPELQYESASALTNITSGTSAQTQVVIDAGAVPVLIRLISSSEENVVEQSVWALGNIAFDSNKYRDLILNSNVLPPLLGLFNNGNRRTSMMRNAAWTLSCLCRGNYSPPEFEQVSPCLPLLARLMVNEDEEVLEYVCQSLSTLCDTDCEGPKLQIQVVINSGVCPRAAQLLSHTSTDVVTAALGLVCNITAGTDSQTQAIINANALPALDSLLSHEKTFIVKEACKTLANITAGNEQQIQSVIDANILPSLIELLHHGDISIRKQAADAIVNATNNGSVKQIVYIAEAGATVPLCKLLTGQGSYLTKTALSGLEDILLAGKAVAKAAGSTENAYATLVKQCGGSAEIFFLTFRKNLKIRKKALDLDVML